MSQRQIVLAAVGIYIIVALSTDILMPLDSKKDVFKLSKLVSVVYVVCYSIAGMHEWVGIEVKMMQWTDSIMGTLVVGFSCWLCNRLKQRNVLLTEQKGKGMDVCMIRENKSVATDYTMRGGDAHHCQVNYGCSVPPSVCKYAETLVLNDRRRDGTRVRHITYIATHLHSYK